MLKQEGNMSQQEKSTFLIKSTTNKSFGTGFCIYKDEHGSFLITCSHVVEECGAKNLLIDGVIAKVIVKGDNKLVYLAVLYVKGLTDTIPLNLYLSTSLKDKQTKFSINGFKPHKQESHKLETIHGQIEKVSSIHTSDNFLKTYELSIEDNDNIAKGYSGSAIIDSKSNTVIAVATDRNVNNKEVYAIPLYHLKSLWQDMPKELLHTKKVFPFKYLVIFGFSSLLLFFIVKFFPILINISKTSPPQEKSSKHFTRDAIKEIVTQHHKNLMWQDDNEAKSTQKSWLEANKHCEKLILGEYKIWRLPTRAELRSILDLKRKGTTLINSVFLNTYPNTPYWTSSPKDTINTDKWVIDFSSEQHSYQTAKKDDYTVRCVRDIE